MTRRRQYAAVFYVCGIALLGLALGVFLTGDSEHLFNGLVPLKEPLASSGVRSSFVAVWSEPHAVAVALPAPSGIAEVDAFVQRATDRVGYNEDRPPFDMTWRAYEKGLLVGSGSGRSGASGVSFGHGFRDFVFGTFPATAGRTYEVVVEVGPGFAPLLGASPWVEVRVATATASVGLALGRSLAGTIGWLAGALGAVALAIAVWSQHSGRAAQQGDEADEAR
jgi:hypothetical protein